MARQKSWPLKVVGINFVFDANVEAPPHFFEMPLIAAVTLPRSDRATIVRHQPKMFRAIFLSSVLLKKSVNIDFGNICTTCDSQPASVGVPPTRRAK